MERRHFLKLAFGFAAGGVALAASAQAAPLMPAPLADDAKLPVNRGCPARRHVGRGGRSPHAGRSALGPRPSSRLAPTLGLASQALGLAPSPLASQALGLASPPSLAPPLLARRRYMVSRRQGLPGIKKAPRERGFCLALENINKRGSVRNATRCRRDTRGRAAPRRPEAPRRPGLDEPQRPGDWVGIRHRGHDASRGRIRRAASAALKLATVPRAKTAAKRYFMFSPVFGRKGGTERNLVPRAEWNMNVPWCYGAARNPSTSSSYLPGASRKTRCPVFGITSARPFAIFAASALASSAFCPIFERSASGALALPGAL